MRDLAARRGLSLVELNFEREPRLARHFESNDPRQICNELSLALNRDLQPGGTLLFLDEIQAAPALLAKLRWFSEELPELAVIAAGSLLEFTLAEHAFSMPVGRIGFHHIEPMSFPEYLEAHGQDRLKIALAGWTPGAVLSPAAHEQAGAWFHRYSMVGGMPAVVAADVAGGDARRCRSLQKDLMATYRTDFARYAGRLGPGVLDSTLLAAATSLGEKFVFSRVGEGVKRHQAKQAIDLLAASRLCTLVTHTAANGLPLAGESKPGFHKVVLLDVGLLHALLDTPAGPVFPASRDLSPRLRGQLAEQLAGQQLRSFTGEAEGGGPSLHYWQREGGRPGEIDYLIPLAGSIVPVELKSGAAGAMKSLHQFMFEKGLETAVRLDGNPPADARLSLSTTTGGKVAYRLLSLPHAMTWLLPKLLA